MNHVKAEVVRQAARDLASAAHGSKAAIVERAAALLDLSPQRTYALIKQAQTGLLGLPAARKRRADANTTALTDAELKQVAGVLHTGRRNGKAMWSIERAVEVLHADGKLDAKLSAGRVSALMRERSLHPDQLAQPSASVSMRTEHPNAVWQIDASVCVLYRTPKGEVALMERDAFYKNKLHNVAKVMNDLVVRFVGTDHCSGAVGVKFYTGGETTEHALDFLIWLMVQRADMPFYGVPFMLYTDQGSCFKAAAFINFCRLMDIKPERHKPRNSRATGSVENAQNLVERGVEGTLRFIDAATITMAMLDKLGEQWMHFFNGTKRHSRHGMTRYSAWSHITAAQLRVPPNVELMRSLPASQPETRRVTNEQTISFVTKGYGTHDYDVRHVPGAAVAEKVWVTVNPFEAPAVNVGTADRETGEIVWHLVRPIERDLFGFNSAAPRLGQDFHAMPLSAVDKNRNAIAAEAYGTGGVPATLEAADKARRNQAAPYLGQFDPLADMKAAKVPAYLPRTGTPLDAPARPVEVARLTVVEACKRLRAMFGRDYQPEVYAWVSAKFTDGVPEDQLEAIGEQFAAPKQEHTDAQTAPVARLRVVGGDV